MGLMLLAMLSQSGLQGYWPLESVAGTSADLSGNGNTLTVSGPASLSPAAFGNGARHDGTDVMTAANSASLNPAAGSFTIAAFVRPAGATVDRIANKYDGSRGWLLDINATTGGAVAAGNLRLRITDGTNNLDYSFAGGLGANPTLFKHVVGVVDRGAAQLRIYVDGVQIGASQALGSVGSLANTAVFAVGEIPTNQGSPFAGDIDEIRYYNRALSLAEIGILRNGVPGPVLSTPTADILTLSLSWTPPAGGAVSYTVQKSASPGGPYATIASGVTGTTYDDMFATDAAPSYYVVVAETSVGASRASNEVSGTALPAPPRFDDHEEGLVDRSCGCGSAAGFPAAWALLASAAAALLAARRR